MPTGYGEIHFAVEVVEHFGRFIKTVVEERPIVDTNAPTMVGATYLVTSQATSTGKETNRSKLA